MKIIISGDFEPEEVFAEIKKYIIMKNSHNEIIRNYPEEPDTIVKKSISSNMEISISSFILGYKNKRSDDDLKRAVAIDILNVLLFGKSSKFFLELYENQLLYSLEFQISFRVFFLL